MSNYFINMCAYILDDQIITCTYSATKPPQ